MRTLPVLLLIALAVQAGKPLPVHFAGWSSLHPDLVTVAEERTREELDRSGKISLLPFDSVAALRMLLDLPSGTPSPEGALAVARATLRRYVVWAHLARLDYGISHPFWKLFLWPDRVWDAEADFFLYDSSKKVTKRASARARERVGLGFKGFTGEELLPAPEIERARESDELLRILSRKLRKEIEGL